MSWLAFSYSLIGQRGSSPRVALWRRVQQIGALAIKNGLYVLPEKEECLEAFQWIAQEVQEAKGEATVMRVERFDGLSDSRLVELFHKASAKKYAGLEQQLEKLERGLTKQKLEQPTQVRKALLRLQGEYEAIARHDFFDSKEGLRTVDHLRRLRQRLASPAESSLPGVVVSEYRDRKWVTRPRPHVDRLACAWLIRQFIDPKAKIRYSNQPEPDEIRFDMRGAAFGHHGSYCTFETMLQRFGLTDSALQSIADIVHEIDLRDGSALRAETAGVDSILKGWLLAKLSDQELETHGLVLFKGLYAAFARQSVKKRQGHDLRAPVR